MIYVKIKFNNTEPVRIVDDSRSQHGECTTLRYIPGSTMRGLVINQLAKEDDFSKLKQYLFSDDVQFMNAYLTVGDKECIPSPKGFYEDKLVSRGEKNIENVVIDGKFDEGLKRADLGDVSFFSDETIRYCSVKTSSDLKIKINVEKRDVFRNEYIMPGHTFVSYIRIGNEELAERIKAIVEKGFRIGNARSSGLGKCVTEDATIIRTLPYASVCQTEDMPDECYMYLLSDTCMRSVMGEPCGIDFDILREKLGLDQLDIKQIFAATSKRTVMGYNRNWKGVVPAVPVYEKGSVFHLRFRGTIESGKAMALMDEGIGIRRNEGFGRVIFLKGYENLKKKCITEEDSCTGTCDGFEIDDQDTLRTVAKSHLKNMINNAMSVKIMENGGGMKQYGASLGTLESICLQYRYQPAIAFHSMEEFFGHALEKEAHASIQKERVSKKGLENLVVGVLRSDLTEYLGISDRKIMGFPIGELIEKKEIDQMKLKLISDIIRFSRKGEV